MTASSLATVSLGHDSGYLGLRDCAQSCVSGIWFDGSDKTGLVGFIGCPFPDYNNCYCNSNIIPDGSSFISACVTSQCSESADISTAFAVWIGYCESAGFPMTGPAQAAATTTTNGAVIGATTEAPTATLTASTSIITFTSGGRTFTSPVSVTATGISNTQTTTGSKLNIGAIVGGAVGLVIVLGIVAVAITMLILRDRRRRRFELQPVTQPPPVYPRDSEVNQQIPKTPVMIHTSPVYAGDRIESGHELDGRTATGAEMEGVGRLTRPEMQG